MTGKQRSRSKCIRANTDLARYNKFLANFQLTEIPRLGRGLPKIEVVFDIDVNGIVHVTAVEQTTGRQQHIQINHAVGLSAEEIARLSQVCTAEVRHTRHQASGISEDKIRTSSLLQSIRVDENLLIPSMLISSIYV